MRSILVSLALFLIAVSTFAQQQGPRPPEGGQPRMQQQAPPEGGRPPIGPPPRCCAKVYDAAGKEFGDVIRWDDRFPVIALQALVRYHLKDGDDVALVVAPESVTGTMSPGGSVALFTTPNCSGNSMFVMLQYPTLTKRYAMVLPVGSNPSTLAYTATNAWLFVSDHLPARVSPGATVFLSQWGDQGACVPYPAPGYTVTGTPMGGFWMHKVEDIYAKFKRPFYSQ
jgi:hypothetical protein